MNRKWKNLARILICGLALQCNALPALANFSFPGPTDLVFFAIDAANQGTSLCAAALTECPVSVPINTAGAPIFTSDTPGIVSCTNCSGGGGGGGSIDETAFTAGTSTFLPGGGFYQTTPTSNPLTNGLQGSFQVTATRALFTNLRNAAGTEIGTTATPVQVSVANTGVNATAIKVDGSGVTQPISGTVTANAGTNLNTSTLATSANQTNASQKTQIVDGAGNVIASTTNSLNVQCANCSSSGAVDEATFTAGTSLFAGVGGFYQTTATSNPLTNGQQGAFQTTANRALFVNLRTSAGAEYPTGAGATGSSTLRTTEASDSPQIAVLGAVGSSASCAAGSNSTLIECAYAQYAALQNGVGATGATAPADAVYLGGVSLSAEPAATTTGYLTGAFLDLAGKLVTSPYANRENMLRCAVTITASTSATTCTGMGAQGSGVKIYVTDATCTRSDAGTTAAQATFNDSATTVIDMPNNGGGGGYSHSYLTPLVIAANTAFQITTASLTSVHCSAAGFKGY
jgi:hypothetical protein